MLCGVRHVGGGLDEQTHFGPRGRPRGSRTLLCVPPSLAIELITERSWRKFGCLGSPRLSCANAEASLILPGGEATRGSSSQVRCVPTKYPFAVMNKLERPAQQRHLRAQDVCDRLREVWVRLQGAPLMRDECNHHTGVQRLLIEITFTPIYLHSPNHEQR